VFYGENTAR